MYTIHKIAKLAGVSIRTLHYYGEIGLLKPSFIGENGYRYYEDHELMRLQQILFFRELDFPLENIKKIMHSPTYVPIEALTEQQKLLELKKKHIEKLLQTITRTIETMKGGETMSNNDKFSAFNDPTYQKYKEEAEQRWGNTDAYKQSMQRVGKLTKEQFEKIKQEGHDITTHIADLMKKGKSANDSDVQAGVDRYFKYLFHFYDPSYEMFKGLGQMYVNDPRFTATYEKYAHTFAYFMRDAMAIYADEHMK